MQIEYKRDLNHSYLVIYGKEDLDAGDYRVRMVTGNRIPSLLPCRLQGLDGENLFYYEITGKQAVSVLYERRLFSWEDLKCLFQGLLEGMKALGEYLLEPDDLVLAGDYLYLSGGKVFLCYLPGRGREFRLQFREWLEELLPKVDPKDGQAVSFAYTLYRQVMDAGVTAGMVEEALFQGIAGPGITEPPPGDLSPVDFQEKKETAGREGRQVSWEGETQGKEAPVSEKGRAAGASAGPEMLEAFLEEDTKRSFEKGFEKGYGKKWICFGVFLLLGLAGAGIFYGTDQYPMETALLGMTALGLALGGGIVAGVFGAVQKLLHWRKGTWKKTSKERRCEERRREEEDPAIKEIFENGSFGERAAVQKVQNWETSEREGGEEPKESFAASGSQETTVLYQETGAACATLVSKHPGRFPTIFLDQEMVVVGKLEAASDVTLPSSAVSRIHARICRQGENFFLTDLNSRNGTCVNGRILAGDEEYQLNVYDEVSFADVQYVFLK